MFNLLNLLEVSLIPGDGIGPEISNSVKIVFEAAKVIRFALINVYCVNSRHQFHGPK